MKLKDIAKYCLNYTSAGSPKQRYYWSIKGRTYSISKIQTYGDYSDNTSFTNLVHLRRYNTGNVKDRPDTDLSKISLNLDNPVLILDNFIVVHQTMPITDDEYQLFGRVTYDSIDGYNQYQPHFIRYYTINLVHPTTGLFMTNLRSLCKDLIDPPAKLKQVERTVEEKIDDLINDLMKDSKTMAIEKLKSMLNERL